MELTIEMFLWVSGEVSIDVWMLARMPTLEEGVCSYKLPLSVCDAIVCLKGSQRLRRTEDSTNGVYGNNHSIRLANGHSTPAAWSQEMEIVHLIETHDSDRRPPRKCCLLSASSASTSPRILSLL
jgi:hypothetical protein